MSLGRTLLKTTLWIFAAVLFVGFGLVFFVAPQAVHREAEAVRFAHEQRDEAFRRAEARRMRIAGDAASVADGLDLAPTIEGAAVRIAGAIESAYRSVGHRGERVTLNLGSGEEAPGESVGRVIQATLSTKGIVASVTPSRSSGRFTVSITKHQGTMLGDYLAANAGDPPVDIKVAYGMPSLEAGKTPARPGELVIRLRTDLTLSEDDAAEDALDALARRIERIALDRQVAYGNLDRDDDAEFMRRFRGFYDRPLLLQQGVYEVFPEERKSSDQSYWLASAIWRGQERRVDRIAESIADAIRFERRLPFIRAGLTLGALVLAVLAWFKLDWWLKGHNAFLTKFACGILFAVAVGLIWSAKFHG